TGRQYDEKTRYARHRPAIAAEEAAKHVQRGAITRTDWLPALVALPAAREIRDALIAIRRILAQRLADDGVEVADQQTSRNPAHRCLRAADPTGYRRVLMEQLFDCHGDRQTMRAPGELPGEQLEEQHAQRIHVSRRRHLFG